MAEDANQDNESLEGEGVGDGETAVEEKDEAAVEEKDEAVVEEEGETAGKGKDEAVNLDLILDILLPNSHVTVRGISRIRSRLTASSFPLPAVSPSSSTTASSFSSTAASSFSSTAVSPSPTPSPSNDSLS
jgi:hypothetical protein